jgi:hypothetical protein
MAAIGPLRRSQTTTNCSDRSKTGHGAGTVHPPQMTPSSRGASLHFNVRLANCAAVVVILFAEKSAEISAAYPDRI